MAFFSSDFDCGGWSVSGETDRDMGGHSCFLVLPLSTHAINSVLGQQM